MGTRRFTIGRIDTRAYAETDGRGCVRFLGAILFIAGVAVAYYRYRDHFYALESATDSNDGQQ
jgi:hypothetical protein